MTEPDWLKAKDPDAMLDHVAGRFTPRRWRLLAAALVRRRWDVLPDGPLRDAVEFIELAPAELDRPAAADRLGRVAAAVGPAVAAAEAAMLDLVRTADPAAADQAAPLLDRPNQVAPAFPLFRAASRFAAQAVELAGRPVELAADAVRTLFDEPGRETVFRAAEQIEAAVAARADANRAASTALKMKAIGDETADRAAAVKNKRLEEAKAAEIVRKVEERADLADPVGDELRADRAVRRAVGRLLHELAGNPFAGYRFDPAWRTATVIDLARGVEADRGFDRLPILADALLDTDCDSEPVLRHLRGTEPHAKDKVQHGRGCWVLDLILRPDDPLFAPAPQPVRRARRPRGGDEA